MAGWSLPPHPSPLPWGEGDRTVARGELGRSAALSQVSAIAGKKPIDNLKYSSWPRTVELGSLSPREMVGVRGKGARTIHGVTIQLRFDTPSSSRLRQTGTDEFGEILGRDRSMIEH